MRLGVGLEQEETNEVDGREIRSGGNHRGEFRKRNKRRRRLGMC